MLNVEDAPGLDIPGLDFCALSRGYGVDALEAGSRESFRTAFKQALGRRNPVLIEVPTIIEL